MSRRRYTHIQKILPEIKAMNVNGKSHREIEEFFGLTGDRPVHNLLKRERRKERKAAADIAACPKGCPRKGAPPRDMAAEQAYEINRLKMENQLLEVRPRVKYQVIDMNRNRLSGVRNVPIPGSLTQRLLRICQKTESTGGRC